MSIYIEGDWYDFDEYPDLEEIPDLKIQLKSLLKNTSVSLNEEEKEMIEESSIDAYCNNEYINFNYNEKWEFTADFLEKTKHKGLKLKKYTNENITRST
jgi:hypothetical protein